MQKERRQEPRERLALPLRLDDGRVAETRDISASGMYLEVSGFHHFSGKVVFEMHLSSAQLTFTAEGEIVRVEHKPDSTGVAVKLVTTKLVPAA